MTMRALITTQPAHGHFHPLVPLARALVASGHDIRFACSKSFVPVVQSCGYCAQPLGKDWLTADVHLAFPELRYMESSLTTAYVIEKIFAGVTAQQMAADILALADDWCPDVIISETYEFGGHIAAEVLNIPFVSAGICLSPPSESVITGLNRVRQTFGLPPDPGLACLYRNLHLHFVPPTLLPANIVAPETVAIRPDPFDLSGTDTLPSWIEEMPDQPTIYMTLGTQFNGLRRVFGAVISAFRDQECNLIVTCGRNMDPRIFGVLPDHIHVERYIPQSHIFPYCDVVICHGGYNTMVGALVHGIPQVYIPISADQPFNAECCESAGTAVVLNKDTLTADLLRQAVHDVLRDPGYLEAARRIQLEISNMPGCDHAVSVIERAVRHNSDRARTNRWIVASNGRCVDAG